MRSVFPIRLALAVLTALALVLPARGQDDETPAPIDVPVTVTAEAVTDDAALTGQVRLDLAFEVDEDVGRPYGIVLRLFTGAQQRADLDHRPEPPTVTWKKGSTVRYALPLAIPTLDDPGAPPRLEVWLGFRDPSTGKVLPPHSGGIPSSGMVRVEVFDVPEVAATDDEEAIQAVLDAAAEFTAKGRKHDAWAALEGGLRRASSDDVKRRFRDALWSLGDFEPRPVSLVERQICTDRVERERQRYLRQLSGRYFDRKQYHAALLVLEEIGGKLEEDADAAVIGALDAAKRAEKDRWDVRDRILDQLTDEEKAEADAAVERLRLTKTLLREAQGWAEKKRYGAARRVFKELEFADDEEVRAAAYEARKALEAAWVADVPDEQRKAVAEALHHPSFDRTIVVPSHHFLLIGPDALVSTIPGESKRRFDLAYVFLTDLFGRRPNPEGDRVTVYFKELWEFGGGVGGGKTIDIGNADPKRRGMRIDNGLLYHELTHCIDDTTPILAGFREGLANVGAVYAYEALDQRDDGQHGLQSNLEAFRKDYVARDLPYWRIQNYGPSAGFFLHFVHTYAARKGGGHDWAPYRRFFRDYRAAPVRDGREPYVARALAYYLVRCFGPKAFDDLIRFRFPLVESDREAITKEMEAFADGDSGVLGLDGELDGFENSPLRRDLLTREIVDLHRNGGSASEVRRRAVEELGVVPDWRVIGPFQAHGADPGACIFPPQYEIDFEKRYPGKGNTCFWRKVDDPGPVQSDPLGWVAIKYPYMDNTATYALCHVTVNETVEAAAHVRADDDFTLFVNDELIDGYRSRGDNGSSRLWWRGPHERAPDAMRLYLRLEKGRNKVLLKIRNRGGPAGFVFALSDIAGRPIPGLVVDLDAPGDPAGRSAAPRFKTLVKHDFKSKSYAAKFDTKVGRFAVVNKHLEGQDDGKRVGWRKYTVRPGFSKDSPSNLIWFKDKFTADVTDFRLRLELGPPLQRGPKLLVTFQGDGGTDGLSGWNLILTPSGDKGAAARLERYDNLVHQSPPVDLPAAGEDDEVRELEVLYVGRRLTVTLGGAVLFDRVAIKPIPGRSAIGLCTWGKEPRIRRIELEAPSR